MAEVTIQEIDPELLERLEAIERSIPDVRTIEDLRRLAHASQERLRGASSPTART